jgi:hypothetical protein
MAIQVKCPNGHALKVNDSFSGKLGLCPVCKVQVQVPKAASGSMSEDDILSMMGSQHGGSSSRASRDSSDPGTKQAAAGRQSPPRKACIKCNREMDVGMRICPHCHTYVGGAGDRR